MANSDKNILITPNKGSSSNPNISFTGFDNKEIKLTVDSGNKGSISIGTARESVFGISSDDSQYQFSVSSKSQAPEFEINNDGGAKLGRTGAEVNGQGVILPKHKSSSLPVNPDEGSLIYDQTAKVPKIFNGTFWDDLSEPAIVTRGLQLYLDPKDMLPHNSVLQMTHWYTGSGSVSSRDLFLGEFTYGQNGGTNENERVYAENPFGVDSIVWETRCSGNGNDDGGWNSEGFTIDNRKMYRFSVWVKRTSSTASGNFYLGLGDYGTQLQIANSAAAGNPYWDCPGVSVFNQSQWYLVVGHVFPFDTSYTGRHPDSGVYVRGQRQRVRDINGCNVGNDVKWASNASNTYHRCYHYYSGDSTTRLQFWDPRIEVCDGTEPSISELLSGEQHIWHDRSGNTNHCYWNNAPRVQATSSRYGDNESIGPSLIFDGARTFGTIKNIQFSSEQTIMMTLNHNYTSGRRNPWNQAYGGYGTWTHEQGENISWYFGDAGANASPYLGHGSPSTPRNQWNILASARSTSTYQWFLNGYSSALQSNPYADLANDGNEILIGNGYAGFWQGNMGPVLAYNRCLTEDEIIQNINVIRRYYK
jgi:hypothetical protein